jgi:hypothetical protein
MYYLYQNIKGQHTQRRVTHTVYTLMCKQKQTNLLKVFALTVFGVLCGDHQLNICIYDQLHLFELVCVRLPPAAADGQPEQDGGCNGSRNDDQCACAEEISKFGGKFEFENEFAFIKLNLSNFIARQRNG